MAIVKSQCRARFHYSANGTTSLPCILFFSLQKAYLISLAQREHHFVRNCKAGVSFQQANKTKIHRADWFFTLERPQRQGFTGGRNHGRQLRSTGGRLARRASNRRRSLRTHYARAAWAPARHGSRRTARYPRQARRVQGDGVGWWWARSDVYGPPKRPPAPMSRLARARSDAPTASTVVLDSSRGGDNSSLRRAAVVWWCVARPLSSTPST